MEVALCHKKNKPSIIRVECSAVLSCKICDTAVTLPLVPELVPELVLLQGLALLVLALLALLQELVLLSFLQPSCIRPLRTTVQQKTT
jgi:hypothetical protein